MATGSDDVLRVVQTLMAAKVITGDAFGKSVPAPAGDDASPNPPQPPLPRRRET